MITNIKECIINNLKFIDDDGSFKLENADKINYLYFPLVNKSGLMSSITPLLQGDIKIDQNTFLLEPVTQESLHNNLNNRNFWIYIDGYGPWSLTGNSAKQKSKKKINNEETVTVEAGLLWHKVTRINKKLNIQAEIINFVPYNNDTVELMRIKIINNQTNPIKISPASAIPIYGRSADNIRDHRHVTSLLNNIYTLKYGIKVKPSLSFDERGHKLNKTSYSILGVCENKVPPVGYWPVIDDFIGEGGSLDWPEKIITNNKDYISNYKEISGFEAIGALLFPDYIIKPKKSISFYLALVIDPDDSITEEYIVNKYLNETNFIKYLEDTKKEWLDEINKIKFNTSDKIFDNWMKWVTVQPVLRRIYGCSFLPHHDYGKGGRGWRDLWQDCLALLLIDPFSVRQMLINNFAGVRIDGSNATIIGKNAGEFLADRNNISRVWMDHGVWPFLTIKYYIDNTGDIDILFVDQVYFKDKNICRSQKKDENWNLDKGTIQLNNQGIVYIGSILEHILIQHLTQFFNVGKNNNIKLENADWNDGLDLAFENGESVAFSAFYASNILEIAKILETINNKYKIKHIPILKEAVFLIDTFNNPINYDSYKDKQKHLANYFDNIKNNITGEKENIDIEYLCYDLRKKALWIFNHIKTNEIIENEDGFKWFNGYYDNDGMQVERNNKSDIRITLAGQVFPLMAGIVSNKDAKKIFNTVKHFLKDEKVGGYRLNTNFNEIKINLGRAFGFAYGHKENGAMFSHMAIMFAYSLYKQNLAHEGWDVIASIYNHCIDFDKSKIYPGIPEYINEKGRGMYHYLTGSASWLLLTMITEVFGIKGFIGDLVIEPKLLKEHFNENGVTSLKILFQNKKIIFSFINKKFIDYGKYCINKIIINNESINANCNKKIISKETIDKLNNEKDNIIEIFLSDKDDNKQYEQ